MAEKSYEEQLHEAIDSGKIDDRMIADILDSGDRQLRQHLEKKADQNWSEKKHLDRLHGKDAFDFKDEQGRLTKLVDLSDML